MCFDFNHIRIVFYYLLLFLFLSNFTYLFFRLITSRFFIYFFFYFTKYISYYFSNNHPQLCFILLAIFVYFFNFLSTFIVFLFSDSFQLSVVLAYIICLFRLTKLKKRYYVCTSSYTDTNTNIITLIQNLIRK